MRLRALSTSWFARPSDVFGPGGASRNAWADSWWSAYALSVAAAICGVALTCLAWYAAFQQENRFADHELSARASDHLLALQNGIDQYINDISALRAAFQASEHGISRREFQSLSDDLFRDKPAIFGTSWAPRVAGSERAAHELEAAREGLADYSIRTTGADANLTRASDADEYFPVFYSSRPDFSAYGLDINDGGIRQRSLERARSAGRPAASANFTLRVGEGDRNGFLVALPMYRPGLPHATVEERRQNFIGLIQGVFQTSAMIEAILAARAMPIGLDLYLFAADSAADAPPFYFHRSRTQTGPSQPMSRAAITRGLHWTGELKVADRLWTVIAVPLPGGPGTAVHSGSTMILAGGLLISAMMAAYFWTVARDTRRLQQREKSFRLLFKGNPMPMWVVDPQTLRFVAVNAAAVAHYGYSRDDFLRMTAFDLRSSEDRERFKEYIEAGRIDQEREIWRHQKADGTSILVCVYHADLTYDGRAARLCAVVDVTERTRAEMKLTEQKMQTDMAINNMSQGLLMFDGQARLVLCNNRYIEMYDLSVEVVKPGCTLRELVDHRKAVGSFSGDSEQYCRNVLEEVAKGTPWTRTIELSGGQTIHVVNRPLPGGGWVATHEDMTERKQAQARIEYLAHHDLLTDLPNRAAFNAFLAKAIERAAGLGEKIAVVCIDLDRFKELNDVFGHGVGDGLLRELSARLRDAAAGAFLARLGGDEFGLVVTEGPQPAAAEHLAARLLAVAAADIVVDGHPLHFGLSAGVAIYPTDGADASALLANADAGLYRAKREERGSVRFFEAQMDQSLRERRALQHDLGSAVGHGEVRLFFQPQASIGGEIIGFEALVRWQHPTRGMIPPGEFISLAEDSGVIVQLGEWVLREACRQAASWVRPLRVAINLSAVQFRHGDLPKLVHAILLETGLAPRRLEFEITESVLMDDFTRAISILRRLKALGVRIAMDDFGTGYSSLSYLQAFPFDKIKIDQTFVSNLDRNQQSAAIVRAIIGLGRALSLPVTAEGVETKEQLAFLADECCDEIQGYLIGRPLPIESYSEAIGKVMQPERKISYAV